MWTLKRFVFEFAVTVVEGGLMRHGLLGRDESGRYVSIFAKLKCIFEEGGMQTKNNARTAIKLPNDR